MRKAIASGLLGGLLVCGSALGAAAAPDRTAPGVPGTANCQGQTAASIAQFDKTFSIPDDYFGVGGASRLFGASPQEIQELIRAYCAGEPLP